MLSIFDWSMLVCSDKLTFDLCLLQQSNEEAKGGREFTLMAGYPPTDLWPDVDKSVEERKLSGQAIVVRWKD